MIERVEQAIITIRPDDEKEGHNVKVDFNFSPPTQDDLSPEVMKNDPVLRAVAMVMKSLRGET